MTPRHQKGERCVPTRRGRRGARRPTRKIRASDSGIRCPCPCRCPDHLRSLAGLRARPGWGPPPLRSGNPGSRGAGAHTRDAERTVSRQRARLARSAKARSARSRRASWPPLTTQTRARPRSRRDGGGCPASRGPTAPRFRPCRARRHEPRPAPTRPPPRAAAGSSRRLSRRDHAGGAVAASAARSSASLERTAVALSGPIRSSWRCAALRLSYL